MHKESLKTPLPVKILSILLFLFGLFAFFVHVPMLQRWNVN
jgi:Sec-independent protein secretion pathway component TatC